MRLEQKVALVTSSSPGICASTAQQLAREGAKVMICGRNATQGRATVVQIQNEGGRASFVLADTAIVSDVQAAINETIATYGRLDILFNHASSRHVADGPLLEVSETVWERIVETTLKSTFFCCQYALPFLQQSGQGTIINLVGPSPEAGSVAAICQGGVLAMTGAIAQQVSANTVTANLIWASRAAAVSPASSAPVALGLLVEPVLYGPGDSSVAPFADIAEAVIYLICHSDMLHGSALIVQPAADDTGAGSGG
ncbi:MAG: SDR family NAD(P)-dependent oxidoreductase [Phormidesmis sp.]